jgi:hypothetical protein
METDMGQRIVRKTKLFWPWQDEQEEIWLEQMSLEGLHLKQARLLARYEFTQGQPQNYTYRLDFQDSLKTKNKEEYLRLFTDAGWEYLGQMGGWQYFRKLTRPGEGTEIFTDPDTKIQKYKRYLTYLGLAFPSFLVVFVALRGSWPEWMMWLRFALILIFSAISIVVSVKVTERIKHLKAL